MIIECPLDVIIGWKIGDPIYSKSTRNLVYRLEWNPCLIEYVWSKPELDQKEKESRKLRMYLRRYERRMK